MNISEIINEYGQGMGRVFADRSKTVGASEIGLCARRMHWQKTSEPADETKTRAQKAGDKRGAAQVSANWGAHVRGSTIETVLWEPAMRARFGDALKLAGKDQKTLVSGDLSATPDGIVVGKGTELLISHGIKAKGQCDVVIEAKSIDPRVNLIEEKSENAFQVQVQMGLIREKTPYKPSYAVISYIDASFWHDVTEFIVPFNEEQYESAKLRAGKILRADAADLKPEGWIKGGKECNWCQWSRKCGAMRGSVPEDGNTTVNPQALAEITDLCRQAAAIQQERNVFNERFRDMQEQIRTRLKELNVKKIPGVVTWSGVKGRVSWDTTAMVELLRQKGVNTDPFQSVGEPTTQLVIDKKVLLST